MFGTAFPVVCARVLLHSNFWEPKSLVMLASPDTEGNGDQHRGYE